MGTLFDLTEDDSYEVATIRALMPTEIAAGMGMRYELSGASGVEYFATLDEAAGFARAAGMTVEFGR